MSKIDETFKEYKITKAEQKRIMDVMDEYRERICNGEPVSSGGFESDILSIFGGVAAVIRRQPTIEYHFCKYVAKDFMEEGRWEEVFQTLYGN